MAHTYFRLQPGPPNDDPREPAGGQTVWRNKPWATADLDHANTGSGPPKAPATIGRASFISPSSKCIRARATVGSAAVAASATASAPPPQGPPISSWPSTQK